MQTFDLVLLVGGSAFLLWHSRHTLGNPRSHGFYRFFAWECMLVLLIINRPWWHEDMFVPRQIVSWVLMEVSLLLAIHSVLWLKSRGGHAGTSRPETDLYGWEKTTSLVTDGVYRYIRHPMYTALLCLAWGIYLKHISVPGTALVLAASVLLWITAVRDEAECRAYFGQAYVDYMQRSKRFVPFLL